MPKYINKNMPAALNYICCFRWMVAFFFLFQSILDHNSLILNIYMEPLFCYNRYFQLIFFNKFVNHNLVVLKIV